MSTFKYYKNGQWNYVNGAITGDTLPIGAIVPYGSATAPTNWLVCDGSAVSRTTYSELFAAIGTSYGVGDGSTTFNLPNLKGRVAVGIDTTQTEFDTIGETGGSKYLQEHYHEYKYGQTAGGDGTGLAFSSTIGTQPNKAAITNVKGVTTGNSGNLQPYQVVCYIIKAGQSAGVLANVSNAESNSQTDTYSCNYSNGMFDFLRTNKTIMPEGQSANCLMMDDVTTKNIMLYYNPINAPETNKMVMWTAFWTDNNNPDSYWTYIALAITLDDHKMWINGYHNATQNWTGWQQL